jgi:7-cyano-7-deazaguanine synthase
MKTAIVLLSGGMDSATLAYVARDRGYGIIALHVNYGQRTETKERECARRIAALLGAVEFFEVDIGYLARIGASALTDRAIPVLDYTETDGELPATYVPFRNGNLLSIATSLAEARGAEAIFIGAQASDYSGYPDCREEFMEAFQQLIYRGTRESTRIQLEAPFVHLNKAGILRIGLALEVPYHETWSCYRSGERACGRCGACHFRKEAFRQVGVRDPIPYGEG